MVGIEAEAPVRKEEAETEMEHIIFMLEPGKKYRESILTTDGFEFRQVLNRQVGVVEWINNETGDIVHLKPDETIGDKIKYTNSGKTAGEDIEYTVVSFSKGRFNPGDYYIKPENLETCGYSKIPNYYGQGGLEKWEDDRTQNFILCNPSRNTVESFEKGTNASGIDNERVG